MNRFAKITQQDFDRALKSPFLDLMLKILRNTYGLEAVQIMPKSDSPFSIVYQNNHMPLFVGVDSIMCSWILNNDEWSENIINAVKQHWMKKFGHNYPCAIVDIGANQGFFTRQLLPIMDNRSFAYCFEPDPENFSILKKNIGFLPNCNLFNIALGPFDRNMELYKDRENHGNYSLNAKVVPHLEMVNGVLQALENHVTVKVQSPLNYENEILNNKLPVIYKSDTQSLDCSISVCFSEKFWRITEIAILELWRIPNPPFYDRSVFRKIMDMFPHKYILGDANYAVSSDDVFEYLNGSDGKGADLFMHK